MILYIASSAPALAPKKASVDNCVPKLPVENEKARKAPATTSSMTIAEIKSMTGKAAIPLIFLIPSFLNSLFIITQLVFS